jgi:hypothetical protein
MNLLDHQTKGRTVFGRGSGFSGDVDVHPLGFDADRRPSGRAARMSVEVMKRLRAFKRSDEPIAFDNRVYRGRIEKRVVPAPYRGQRPCVPGLFAAFRRNGCGRRVAVVSWLASPARGGRVGW